MAKKQIADDEDSVGGDYLPAILEDQSVELTLPDDIKIDDTLKQVKSADLQMSNDMLRVCYAGFNKASTISSLTKLIDSTLKTMEHRRKVLCMQFGASTHAKEKEEYEFLD